MKWLNSFKAIYSFITIKEAEEFGNSIGCELHKFKKGRGIIGFIAAIGLPLEGFHLVNCWRIGCLKIMVLKDTLIMIPFI